MKEKKNLSGHPVLSWCKMVLAGTFSKHLSGLVLKTGSDKALGGEAGAKLALKDDFFGRLFPASCFTTEAHLSLSVRALLRSQGPKGQKRAELSLSGPGALWPQVIQRTDKVRS